jgi:hypothetical protein
MELSSYYFADEIRSHYAGMMVAIKVIMPDEWERYDKFSAAQLARALLRMAAHVRPRALRKHPRGPKPLKKKGYASGSVARRHVATARVLKNVIS